MNWPLQYHSVLSANRHKIMTHPRSFLIEGQRNCGHRRKQLKYLALNTKASYFVVLCMAKAGKPHNTGESFKDTCSAMMLEAAAAKQNEGRFIFSNFEKPLFYIVK